MNFFVVWFLYQLDVYKTLNSHCMGTFLIMLITTMCLDGVLSVAMCDCFGATSSNSD